METKYHIRMIGKENLEKTNRIKTISLFTGGGGLDLGLSAVGFDIQLVIELDPFSCKTIEINEGKRPFLEKCEIINKDITQVSVDEVERRLNSKQDEIEALIGGPPCQAFSVFGKRRGLSDARGNLVWEYLRILKAFEPKLFIFENVAGLKTIHNGDLFKRLLEELSCNGLYTVTTNDFEIADYGIPQFRKRVIFIGVKNGKLIPPMKKTHGEHGDKPYITAGKALRGMPEPSENHNLTNHIGRKHSQRIIDRYSKLAFGERDHHTRINKINPDRPSFTIIVGSDKGGGKGHIHPYTPREVTPRESARIQTFPDWWEFYGRGRHVIRQVGNAVPPLFAALLGQHILKHAFGRRMEMTYEDIVSELDLQYLR